MPSRLAGIKLECFGTVLEGREVQYTTVASPNHATSNLDWRAIGTFHRSGPGVHAFNVNGGDTLKITGLRIKTSDPGACIDELQILCSAQYVLSSAVNSDCPSGYTLIRDEEECFAAYDMLQVGQGWTGGHVAGTWSHVMQCGVHLALSHGANNGNTMVHFKTDLVDGSSPSEDWVHICKLQARRALQEHDKIGNELKVNLQRKKKIKRKD